MGTKSKRQIFFDNIRWVIIILVVLMHLNVTYSNMGLWYYKEPREMGMLSSLLFGIYGSFNQAYMMGLLFFIAGYFVPRSLDKKGTRKFIRDRFIRLGVPTLIYMLLIHPVTMLIMDIFDNIIESNFFSWYLDYLISLSFLSSSGPLWFTLALLIFSFVYALINKAASNPKVTSGMKEPVLLSHTKVISVIGMIALIAFLIRIVIPAGVPLLNTKTGNFMQLGYFSSYIVLFILGIICYRRNIIQSLSYKFGVFWFRITLIIGFPLWLIVMIVGGIANPDAIFGGLHWQSAAFSIWESFFCVGITIGFITIFREKFNKHNKLSSFLSDNAFGIYVFHTPILVLITMALRGIVINPLIKMYMLALLVLPACYLFSFLVRKIPVFKKIFS